jgi:predicted RNA binding protein YcfA (HicA-like mRNA interferase family)
MAGEAKFKAIKKRLEALGYELVRVRGSHHIFDKPYAYPVSIPVHGNKVKPAYVRMVEKLEQAEQDGDE